MLVILRLFMLSCNVKPNPGRLRADDLFGEVESRGPISY